MKHCAEFFQLSGQTSYYHVIFETLSWYESAARCRHFHPRSRLVAIETEAEFVAVRNYVYTVPGEMYKMV